MLHLSHNIKLIRLLSGLTQFEFGKKFEATKAMVVSYESGKAEPNELFISRLADYAGIDSKDLINKALKEKDIKVEKEEKLLNVSADYKDLYLQELVENKYLTKKLHETQEKCRILEQDIKSNLETALSNQKLMLRQIAVASRMIVENMSKGDRAKLQEGLDKIDRLVAAGREYD